MTDVYQGPAYDPKDVAKKRARHRRVLKESTTPPHVIEGGCSGLVSGLRKEDCFLKTPKEIPEKTKQTTFQEADPE